MIPKEKLVQGKPGGRAVANQRGAEQGRVFLGKRRVRKVWRSIEKEPSKSEEEKGAVEWE